MRHGDALVIPYGTSDTAIGFATVPFPPCWTECARPAPLIGTRLINALAAARREGVDDQVV